MTNYSNFDGDELLALSDWHFQNNQYDQALDKLKALVTRQDAPLQSHALIGRIYATLGLFDKAKKAFVFYLEHQSNPNMRVNEIFQLGLVEKDSGNIEAALRAWDDLLINYPNHTPCLYHKAIVLVDLKQYQQAADILNYILENAEDNDRHIQLADQMLNNIALR